MQLIRRMKVIPVDQGVYMLLNGLTGAIDLIDDQVYQLYLHWQQQREIDPTESSLMYHNFLERGYLVMPGEEEMKIEELFAKLEQKMESQRPRVDPVFLLTYNCNFRCSYCYESKILQKGREYLLKKLTPETVNGLFDYFERNGVTIGEVTLFGGEPLLLSNEDTVQAILGQAQSRDLPVTVTTNGYTLAHYAPQLAKVKVESVQVTLDGDRERHNQSRFLINGEGTFDQILHGLQTASEYSLPLLVRCNVEMGENGQVEKLLASLDECGLTAYSGFQLYIAPVAREDSMYKCGHDFLREYLQKIDNYVGSPILMERVLMAVHRVATNFLDESKWKPAFFYCGAQMGKQIFDPWGKIYPCQIIVGEDEHLIGHFDQSGDITYNSNFGKWQRRTVKNISKCRECTMALFCGGGCAISSYQLLGDTYQGNCETIEHLEQVFLPYLYRRYLRR